MFRILFLIASAAVVAGFLYLSHGLVQDLGARERERMEIWADATKELVTSTTFATDDTTGGEFAPMGTDIDFLLRIIRGNTTIPVLLTDDRGNILQSRNFTLPVDTGPDDTFAETNEENLCFLQQKLEHLKADGTHVIDIELSPGVHQYLYYEDSTLLKRLSYYPYVQLGLMVVFILVVYFAVLSTKKAEQNRVWVGLSKETAHQLGTPISSLMAWLELLRDTGTDPDTIQGMDMDIRRLETIASRFSKIGSVPSLEPTSLNHIIGQAAGYMQGRISRRITLTFTPSVHDMTVRTSAPLMEWVIENLIKNAVDAMDGHGTIDIRTWEDHSLRMAVVEVTDSGKGMTRQQQRKVFNAGYTTKKRGWGLGLTLARRIIAQYHHGRIAIAASAPGQGTTFRIELPLAK